MGRDQGNAQDSPPTPKNYPVKNANRQWEILTCSHWNTSFQKWLSLQNCSCVKSHWNHRDGYVFSIIFKFLLSLFTLFIKLKWRSFNYTKAIFFPLTKIEFVLMCKTMYDVVVYSSYWLFLLSGTCGWIFWKTNCLTSNLEHHGSQNSALMKITLRIHVWVTLNK